MNTMKLFPRHDRWTVHSVADNSGRRILTISEALIRPNVSRRNPKKRRPAVVLIVKSTPEALTAFNPVIRVRIGHPIEP